MPFEFGGGSAKRRPSSFIDRAEALPDPLADVEYTDPPDLAEDSRRELDAVQKGWRSRAEQEQKRRGAATDAGYWFAIYFASTAERVAFQKALGIMGAVGDSLHGNGDTMYLDGHKVAKILGVSLD